MEQHSDADQWSWRKIQSRPRAGSLLANPDHVRLARGCLSPWSRIADNASAEVCIVASTCNNNRISPSKFLLLSVFTVICLACTYPTKMRGVFDQPKSSTSSWPSSKINGFRSRVGGSNLAHADLFISTLVFFFKVEIATNSTHAK